MDKAKAYTGDYGCYLPLCKECIGDLVKEVADRNPSADNDTAVDQIDHTRAIVAGHIVQQLRLKHKHAASKQDLKVDNLADEIGSKLSTTGGCK